MMDKDPKTSETPESPPGDQKALEVRDPGTEALEKPEEEGPQRFVEKGPHVIHDTETGIYWMKKDSWLDKGKFFNWHEGKEYALTKNIRKIGGFNDWRMPTSKEASTLYDEAFENSGKGGVTLHIPKPFPEGSFKVQWVMADTSTKRPRFDYTTGKVVQADEYAFGSVRLCRRDPVKREDRRVRPAARR